MYYVYFMYYVRMRAHDFWRIFCYTIFTYGQRFCPVTDHSNFYRDTHTCWLVFQELLVEQGVHGGVNVLQVSVASLYELFCSACLLQDLFTPLVTRGQ